MLQRIQTVYILLGALAIVFLFFIDAAWSGNATAFGWYLPVLLGLAAVILLGAAWSVSLYRRRETQLKVVVAVQVMMLLFLLIFFGGMVLAGDFDILEAGADNVARVLGFLLPILAYVFFFLARRGIQRDIALVKSMERLR